MQKFKGLISGAKNKATAFIKNRLPEELRTPDNWLNYASVPWHSGKAFADQLRGAAGKANLNKGLLTGTGLSGASIGLDMASGNDVNKTRAGGLGILGAISPGAYAATSAAKNTARLYYDIYNRLAKAGIHMEPGIKDMQRWEYLHRLKNKLRRPSRLLSIVNSRGRKDIKKFLTPSDTVEVGLMTNAEGELPQEALRQSVSAFGKRVFDAGGIINPNVARTVQSGAADRELKGMGFIRHVGEMAPVRKIGPDLGKAVDARYREILNKSNLENANNIIKGRKFSELSDLEKAQVMPTSGSVFPLDVKIGDRTIRLDTGKGLGKRTSTDWSNPNAPMAPPDDAPHIYYKSLSLLDKAKLRSQGINNSGDYERYINKTNDFVRGVSDMSKAYPDTFLNPKFRLPGVKTVFTKPNNRAYDHKL